MKVVKKPKDVSSLNPLLGGTISGILFGTILSIITGFIYYFTPLKESLLPTISLIILVLSTFWAGKTAAAFTGSRGLIWGAALGITFFLIIVIISMLLGFTPSISSILKKLLFCIVGGSLGGVFGVSK